jgi:hypothetical protein
MDGVKSGLRRCGTRWYRTGCWSSSGVRAQPHGFALHNAILVEDDLSERIGRAVKPSFEFCLLLREIPSDRVSIDDGPGFNQVNSDSHDDTSPNIGAAPATRQGRELAADLKIRVFHRRFSRFRTSLCPPLNCLGCYKMPNGVAKGPTRYLSLAQRLLASKNLSRAFTWL